MRAQAILAALLSGLPLLGACRRPPDAVALGKRPLAAVAGRVVTTDDFVTAFYALSPEDQRRYGTWRGRTMLLALLIRDRLMQSPFAPRAEEWAVPDTAVRRYFNFHNDDFEGAQIFDYSGIYLTSSADVLRAQRRLAIREPFDQVARSMSGEPASARLGGRREPLIANSRKSNPIGRVLEVLTVGQISGPIAVNGGTLIVRLGGVRPATAEAAAPEIRKELEPDRVNDWIRLNADRAGIEIDYAMLAALECRAPRE